MSILHIKKQQKEGKCCIMKRKDTSTEMLKSYIAESLLILMRKKPFNEISIKEITTKAGVNRSTYYRNFNSKTDIIMHYFITLHNDYIKNIRNTDITTEENIYGLFNYYYKHKENLLIIHKNGISHLILDSLNELFKPIIKKQTYDEIYKAYFYAGGVFNSLLLWLSNNMNNKSRHIYELHTISEAFNF